MEVPSGLVDIIYKVGDALNIEIIKYHAEDAVNKGDSFIGGIYKIIITGLKNKQKVKNVVIIKWIPSPEKRLQFREAYKREIMAYVEIIPMLLDVQRSLQIIDGLRMKFTNIILTSSEPGNEFFSGHFLNNEGFKMIKRNQKPDFDHAYLVMKDLAKLHALSFILEKKKPNEYKIFKRDCSKDVQYWDPMLEPKYMRHYYDASVNVVRDPIAKEKLERLAPYFFLVLNKCTTNINEEYSCLCHGDCWSNNILFKYNKQQPIDLCFIDYQLMRYASPVTDISFYFSMSTDHDLRSKHYSQLLDIYYGTLSAVLREGSLDVNEIYPRKIFEQHLKKYSVLGLVEALIALKIITGRPEDALDMTEMKEKITTMPSVDEQKESLFIERVNGVVNDFFSCDYSLDNVLAQLT